MGLRDWVSEMAGGGKSPGLNLALASMGLRDWVSEMEGNRRLPGSDRSGFNGAPRLGLGDGPRRIAGNGQRDCASMGLRDWVSEMAGHLFSAGGAAWLASMGLRDWVSEMGNSVPLTTDVDDCFNGAPRLGLGDGFGICVKLRENGGLQWGSETGSRRWRRPLGRGQRGGPASMGLRDWVSEMVPSLSASLAGATCFNGAPRLGLGDGGSPPTRSRTSELVASMGLRDWVSEMVITLGRSERALWRFNGAPRLGLGDGVLLLFRPENIDMLQWGSETGSRRWPFGPCPTPSFGGCFNGAPRLGLGDGARLDRERSDLSLLQWGSETGSRRWHLHHPRPPWRAHASMGLRDWVSEMAWSKPRLSERPRTSMGLRDWVSEMG